MTMGNEAVTKLFTSSGRGYEAVARLWRLQITSPWRGTFQKLEMLSCNWSAAYRSCLVGITPEKAESRDRNSRSASGEVVPESDA